MSAAYSSDDVVQLRQRESDAEVEELVEGELRNLRVRAEARRRYAAENDPHRGEAVDAGTLAEVLARPDDDAFRIERLLPAGGRLLISAQAKTGKTNAAINLAGSLITGRPFLGTLPTRPIEGNVVFVNLEVTARQAARWFDEAGVPHDRVFMINLRGRRNLFADDDGRAELVRLIREADGQVLIVDPFGRAFTGASQNDAAEVAPWLVALDGIAEQAGCTEVVLTAHAGWNGDRTRGSSALEDWPDVIVTMTKDDVGNRYLRAVGRDVDLEEDRLSFDPTTRALTLTGAGNRTQANGAAADAALARFLADNPAASGRVIEAGLGAAYSRAQIREAIKRGGFAGWLVTEPGEKNATLHSIKAGSTPPGTLAAPIAIPDFAMNDQARELLDKLSAPARASSPANTARTSAPVRQSSPAHTPASSAPPLNRGALANTQNRGIPGDPDGALDDPANTQGGDPA